MSRKTWPSGCKLVEDADIVPKPASTSRQISTPTRSIRSRSTRLRLIGRPGSSILIARLAPHRPFWPGAHRGYAVIPSRRPSRMSSAIQIQNVSKTFTSRHQSRNRRGPPQTFVRPRDKSISTFSVRRVRCDRRAERLWEVDAARSAWRADANPPPGRILIDGTQYRRPRARSRPGLSAICAVSLADRDKNVEFGLEAQGASAAANAPNARGALPRTWSALAGISRPLSARAVRRHEAARRDRAQPRLRSRRALDGRAVRGARRADPRDFAGRACCASGRNSGKTIVFITHGIDEAIYLGQRVAVMTSRPGRIKQVIDIPL